MIDPALQRLASSATESQVPEFEGEIIEENTDSTGDFVDFLGQVNEAVTAPQTLVPKLTPLPALRVAVMSAGAPGEVRIVPLDGATAPPPGAAVAMLVPLTSADGDEIIKLFGAVV